jgi:hypothetical protein
MKTMGRILIILAVFGLVMGITYGIVSARSSFTPGFGAGNERFSSPNGAQSGFPAGGRPEFQGRDRNELRGGRGGAGWLFETLKNIVIIGIIVALIVVPKSRLQKRKRAAQMAAG